MLQREPLSLAAPPCGRPGQAKACPSCPQEQKHKKRSIHVLHKPDSFRCFLQPGCAGNFLCPVSGLPPPLLRARAAIRTQRDTRPPLIGSARIEKVWQTACRPSPSVADPAGAGG